MKRYVDRTLLLILLISIGTNLVLLYRLRRPEVRPIPPSSLVGRYVTTANVLKMDNTWATIDLRNAGKPTVLYIFRAGCHFCEQNQSDVDKLMQAAGDRFRFIGLATTGAGLTAYVSKHQMNFPVYVGSVEFMKSLNLGTTPQTLVLNESGQIVKDWSGTFAGPHGQQIQDYFNGTLK